MRLPKQAWLSFFIAGSFGLLLLSIVPGRLVAQNNIVRTTICDSESAPLLVITEPESDSLVALPTVEVAGSTERTTQIDVFVNNAYSSSIAVEPNGTFSVSVPLKKGNNTIRLESYFSCNQNTSTDTIVLTYVPRAQPSDGAGTDTNIDPNQTDEDKPIETTDADQPNSNLDDDGGGGPGEDKSPVDNFKEKLLIQPADGDSTSITSDVINPIVNWLGLGLVALGIFSMIFPFAAMGMFGLAAKSTIFGLKVSRFIRITALILIILLTFVLLLI